jgi:hypothetical protein
MMASAIFEMKSFHLPFFVFTTTSCNIYYTTSLERIAKQQQHKQESPLALVGSRFCNGLLNSVCPMLIGQCRFKQVPKRSLGSQPGIHNPLNSLTMPNINLK